MLTARDAFKVAAEDMRGTMSEIRDRMKAIEEHHKHCPGVCALTLSKKLDDRVDRHDVELAEVRRDRKWLWAVLGSTGVAMIGVATKLLFFPGAGG